VESNEGRMNKKRTDTFAGLVILCWGIIIFCATFNMKSMVDISVGPEVIPRVVAVALCILGLVELIRGIREKNTHQLQKTETKSSEKSGNSLIEKLLPLITFVLLFIFIFLLKPLGFILSSFFYLTFQITVLSKDFSWRNWLKSLLIGFVTSIVVYLIFRKGLGLLLPRGIFGF
jgi:putative tricarboxylic transport membrane protein